MILKHGQSHQWLWTSPGGVSGSQGSQHSSCSSGSWQPSSLQLKMVACCWVTLRACVSNSPGWRERGAEIFKTSLRISQGDSDETGPGFFLYVCQPLMGPNGTIPNLEMWSVLAWRGRERLWGLVFASVCAQSAFALAAEQSRTYSLTKLTEWAQKGRGRARTDNPQRQIKYKQ